MTHPAFSLDRKVAVVTGATRGLGFAIAFELARAGARIVVSSRKADSCATVAGQIEEQTGTAALPFPAHVGRWEECDALVNAAIKHFGQIDVLVNNAGMSPIYSTLLDVTEDLFDKVVDVNVKGAFRLSVLVAEHMAGRETGGSIINISSIAAVRPRVGEIPYAIAKSGLNTLTLGLSHAYGPRVRTNAIMAGPFLTDVSAHWDMEAFQRRAQTEIPLQRAGRPDEIAAAVLYLASDASSYTTGAIIKIDGGLAWSPA